MPRKQNGFGPPANFKFKNFEGTRKGKVPGAAGFYPADRSYGSTVHRSVIEKYNLDSNWVKWRKGFEYYNQAAWYRLEVQDPITLEYEERAIKSKLYQGSPYEIDVEFDGFKFATKDSDSNNHYVMKRRTTSKVDLGTITSVQNDIYEYTENKKNREIWCQGTPGPDSRLLLQMIGERITDGETEASLTYILTPEKRPGLFIGKSSTGFSQPTVVKVEVPLGDLVAEPGVEIKGDYSYLINSVVYIQDFFVEKSKDLVDKLNWIDGIEYFGVEVEDFVPNKLIEILDATQEALPPSMYDISTLPKLFTANNANYTIKSTYVFKKDLYQRFYGRENLAASIVDRETDNISYSILPFRVLSADVIDGKLSLTSIPATTEVKFYTAVEPNSYLVFADHSFTKTSIDEYDGNYYHNDAPDQDPWLLIDTDVNPWMDEVFTTGAPLKPATIYTCSCPNHSHAILSSPQSTQDEGSRKINRQRRYPLPTVLGQNDFDALGRNKVAGKIESWESRDHRMSFKMCKHSIAAMYIDRIKIKEPSEYPTLEAREAFEEKLRKDIEEVAMEFRVSYKRGGITALEVLFALAQGLNLDDVELAYVMFNNNF